MSAAYRAGRAVLAVTGALALAGFIGWHVLVWRMGEVYRRDSMTTSSSSRPETPHGAEGVQLADPSSTRQSTWIRRSG